MTNLSLFIVFLCMAAQLPAFLSVVCVPAYLDDSRDALAFGSVPWGFVAMGGYLVIALSEIYYPTLATILIALTGALTLYLMMKAIRLRMGCPDCFAIWAINFLLLALVANRYFAAAAR